MGSLEYSAKIIIEKIRDHLPAAILHQSQLRWKSHAFELDYDISPNSNMVISTDFGASLDLQAKEKDDYAAFNHAAVYDVCFS